MRAVLEGYTGRKNLDLTPSGEAYASSRPSASTK